MPGAFTTAELSKGQFLLVPINPPPSLTATGQEATYTGADKPTTTITTTIIAETNIVAYHSFTEGECLLT